MKETQQKIAVTIGIPVARRHIFLCADQAKPKCCDLERGVVAWDYLKKRLKELGLAEQGGILRLLAFVVVCIGVLVLRITQPNVERPFKTPAVFLTAPLGALSAFALMSGLPGDTWLRLAIWLVIGFVIYFVYGASHSKLGSKA